MSVTDTERIHDSIVTKVVHDTLIMERWHTLWRERLVHDTVLERHTDTVIQTKIEEKAVNVPTESGKTGWIVASVLALVMVFKTVIKTILKR